jgi:hypothetical protein
MRLEVGGKKKTWWVKAAYELLEGQPGDGAFTTPLATLFKWNGWADKFLSTPGTGLEDLSISAGRTHGAFKSQVVYHDFTADSGGADYGTELDVGISWKASWDQTIAAMAALYEADDFSDDTKKFWVYTTYAF